MKLTTEQEVVKLLRDSYDLQSDNPDKSSFWHLNQLRHNIRQLALQLSTNGVKD